MKSKLKAFAIDCLKTWGKVTLASVFLWPVWLLISESMYQLVIWVR